MVPFLSHQKIPLLSLTLFVENIMNKWKKIFSTKEDQKYYLQKVNLGLPFNFALVFEIKLDTCILVKFRVALLKKLVFNPGNSII